MSEIYDGDENRNKFSLADLGDRLFSDKHNTRNTQILHKELVGLNILYTLGKLQDKYREDFLNNEEESTLTKLVKVNLQLRTSILGWRSNQIVEILKSHPTQIVQPTQPNIIDNTNVKTKKGIFGLKR